jgi:3-oxoacyl-[acyl-carrier-protein] synthase-1
VIGILGTTVVHPAGQGVQALWTTVSTGRSALKANQLPWCSLSCWIGEVAGVADVVLPAHLQSWDCRNNRLAWLALQDDVFRSSVAGAVSRYGAHRVGLVLGTSTSGIRSTEIAYRSRQENGRWPADFDYRKMHSVEAVCRFSAEVLGVRGPMATMSTACSSSAKAFLTARRWIEAGMVDAAIVGGIDSLCLSTLHGFDSLQLLSGSACRPFDADRNGISIGEAAGYMLLGREPASVQFAGGGESSDAWHMSTPHPEGEGAQVAMRAAMATASLGPEDIGYVNAHGTATPANDRSEAAALCAVFGPRGVPVSSTKGVTGHTLAAAGIVEAIVTTQALERQWLPPNANCVSPDPALEVAVVTAARPISMRHAMTNNFGFGGSNCALIFSLAR